MTDAAIQLPGALRSVAVVGGEGDSSTSADGMNRRQIEQDRQQAEAERQNLRQARAALDAAAQRLGQFQDELAAEAEQQLLDLAMEIARKVLMQEIRSERHEIDPIVEEALKHLPARRDVAVHLNPNDFARCRMAQRPADESPHVRFVADPNVLPAECFLETREGTVEASVSVHLAQIADTLKGPE